MINPIVKICAVNFPYADEFVCFFLALQGAMAVRNSANKDNSMNWFHVLLKSTVTAYSGGIFTVFFMGRPTAMLSNDVFFATCLLSFLIVNCLPFDIGYKLFCTLPGRMLSAAGAQMFRSRGCAGFSDMAFNAFKDKPSAYYPIPFFGPIILPSLLANVGGFFSNGFDGHLKNGMPWNFQQAVACATFYHFYTHDTTGIIGTTLRSFLKPAAREIMVALGAKGGEVHDDYLFAKFMVGAFQISMAVLKLPEFLGPSFNPFTALLSPLSSSYATKPKADGKGKSKKAKKKTQ